MSNIPAIEMDDNWILDLRGEKNPVETNIPYDFSSEKERTRDGNIEDVITVFLSNKECVFRCLMCDLWKNTTNIPVRTGEIPAQIKYALEQLSPAKHIKLYNSGNFFDTRSIPVDDYLQIAALLSEFDTLLVECHPKLINRNCLDFKEILIPELQIAMGLETANPEVLQKLNKQMTLRDFEQKVLFLRNYDIPVRAFILLKPPFLSEEEGVEWAKRSIDFSFDIGVECCTIIPTRAGNGAMEWLQLNNYFQPPTLYSLEEVVEYGIGQNYGRVFADLWDVDRIVSCKKCAHEKTDRLQNMNWSQSILPSVKCNYCESGKEGFKPPHFGNREVWSG